MDKIEEEKHEKGSAGVRKLDSPILKGEDFSKEQLQDTVDKAGLYLYKASDLGAGTGSKVAYNKWKELTTAQQKKKMRLVAVNFPRPCGSGASRP